MGPEFEKAKFLHCMRCGAVLQRGDSSREFFSCDGGANAHPIYLVSSKFDTKDGVLPEGPWMAWWEKLAKKNI